MIIERIDRLAKYQPILPNIDKALAAMQAIEVREAGVHYPFGVEKYEGGMQHFMKITEGMAYVCFPWDGHKAVFHIDQPLEFTKAVIKLEV